MSKRRLFSSAQIIGALQRAGYEVARKSGGGHESYIRQRPDGGHDIVIVPRNKTEIPRGTFDSILDQAKLTYDEFLDLAGIKIKGRKRKQRDRPDHQSKGD